MELSQLAEDGQVVLTGLAEWADLGGAHAMLTVTVRESTQRGSPSAAVKADSRPTWRGLHANESTLTVTDAISLRYAQGPVTEYHGTLRNGTRTRSIFCVSNCSGGQWFTASLWQGGGTV